LRGSQDGADALEELERLRARQPIGIVSVAQPWADRARQELRASGETARKRDPRPHCS
jgi:hypothetical protein